MSEVDAFEWVSVVEAEKTGSCILYPHEVSCIIERVINYSQKCYAKVELMDPDVVIILYRNEKLYNIYIQI